MAVVTAALKRELLALKKEDLTVPFLVSKIAKTTKMEYVDGKRVFNIKEPEWNLKAKMKLAANEYINTTDIETTLGRFLFNKLVIEGFIDSIMPGGYFNETVTSKSFGKIMNDVVAAALMEEKIPLIPNVTKFIQYFEFYGLKLVASLSPSITPGTFDVNDLINKRKQELLANLPEHPTTVDYIKVEDELVEYAKMLLKDDPGMTIYSSGARGSFDDNYKNISIMIGPVLNPATGKYDIVTNNYVDGITKQDLPAVGNSIVNAAYPKAVGTEEGGYKTKQFFATYQSIVLDEPGTDCGSKGYLTVTLTSDIINSYLYQYIAEADGSLTLLTEENKDKYLNKTVNFRSPIGCLSEKICSKCAGERYYKLGIENAGLTAGRISNGLMNANMKAFHITKVKYDTVDPDKLLIS